MRRILIRAAAIVALLAATLVTFFVILVWEGLLCQNGCSARSTQTLQAIVGIAALVSTVLVVRDVWRGDPRVRALIVMTLSLFAGWGALLYAAWP